MLMIATAMVLAAAFSPAALAHNTMAVQPDGKVLLVGGREYGGPGTLVRFDARGALDPSFGKGGIVRDERFTNGLSAVAVAPGGDIVVGGGAGLLTEAYVPIATIGRYMPSGLSDTDFGSSGLASAGAGRPTVLIPRADGSLVVGKTEWRRVGMRPFPTAEAGGSAQLYGPSGHSEGLFGRILPSSAHPSSVADLLAEPDGSLIAAGIRRGETVTGVVLARFIPGSGSEYDASFGAGHGLVTPEINMLLGPYPEEVIANANQPALAADEGMILLVTQEAVPSSLSDTPLLMRFAKEGVLDPSFGEGGLLRPKIPGITRAKATASAVQPDGEIVAVFAAPNQAGQDETFAARFSPSGKPDPSFGQGGFAHIVPKGNNVFGMVGEDLRILPEGKIVVGGKTPSGETLVVARLDANGEPDSSFGDNGIASATPCPGRGCGAEVTAGRLRVFNLRGTRKPRLRLHLRMSGPPSWTIGSVKILLPHALRLRPRLISRAWAEPLPSRMLEKATATSATFSNLGTEKITLILGGGLLRRAQRIGLKRRLVFQIKVGFEGCPCGPVDSTSSQTLILRRHG